MDNPTMPAPTAAGARERALVRGCANSGKTLRAVERAARLVEGGCDPASVLFVAASPTAARDARRALAVRCPKTAGVRVATAPEVELALLADPAARAFTGRRPRVLTDFEWDLVLEDMRAQAVPTKNLKGMLGFFERSWTELADDDMDAFIIDPRERMAHDAVKGYLAAYEAMHPCEVANLCVGYLRSLGDGAARVSGAAHVVVDGYQALNRASQIALELLDPQTLWAFADPDDAAAGSDPFPYAAGVAEFTERNPGCRVEDLEPPAGADARGAARRLADSGYLGALTPGLVESRGREEVAEVYGVPASPVPYEGVSRTVCATPREELAHAARRVRELLDGGAAPAEVLVAVPNANWAKGVAAALDREGVAWQQLRARQEVGGDYRRLDACGSGRMYAALGLLADPTDPLSWRVWCGCGDYVGRSTVFKALVPAARARGLALGEALGAFVDGALEIDALRSTVEDVYRQGRAMVDELAGLPARELLPRLAGGLGLDGVPAAFARARDEAGEGADAAELFAAVRRIALAPALAGDEGGVRVVDYARVAGLKARHALVAGCMNGWLPPHAYFDAAEAGYEARQRMDRTGRRTLYSLAGCATESLEFSGFASCDLETAERLKLKGYRVSLGPDGRRVTTCRTSVLLDYALDAWGLAPAGR